MIISNGQEIVKLRKLCLGFRKVDWFSEEGALFFRDLENLLLESREEGKEEAENRIVERLREKLDEYQKGLKNNDDEFMQGIERGLMNALSDIEEYRNPTTP